MIVNEVVIHDPMGFHARLVSQFCARATSYQSSVQIRYQGNIYNGKSVLSIMGLSIRYGESFTLICNGRDEGAAMNALMSVFQRP